MDAFTLEALTAAGCLGLGIAVRRGRLTTGRAAMPPTPRSIGKIPYRHRRRAHAIVAIAQECLQRHPSGSYEAFTAGEALRSYLPETIAAYLAVPPALRGTRRAGRPSPNDELTLQLRTLYGGLERLREADAESAAGRMAANRDFLHERFGQAEPARLGIRTATVLQELIQLLGNALHRA